MKHNQSLPSLPQQSVPAAAQPLSPIPMTAVAASAPLLLLRLRSLRHIPSLSLHRRWLASLPYPYHIRACLRPTAAFGSRCSSPNARRHPPPHVGAMAASARTARARARRWCSRSCETQQEGGLLIATLPFRFAATPPLPPSPPPPSSSAIIPVPLTVTISSPPLPPPMPRARSATYAPMPPLWAHTCWACAYPSVQRPHSACTRPTRAHSSVDARPTRTQPSARPRAHPTCARSARAR